MASIWGNRTDLRGFKLIDLMFCSSHSATVPFFASKAHTNFISWAGFYCQEMWFSFGVHLNKSFSLGPKKFWLKHCRPRMALEQAKPEWPVKTATKQEIFFQSFFFHPFRAMEGTKKRKGAERQGRKHTQDGAGMSPRVFPLCAVSLANQSKTKGTRHNDATGTN